MNQAEPSLVTSRPRALIVGATGLVGRHCLSLLARDPGVSLVRALVRRPAAVDQLLPPTALVDVPSGKVELPVVDFENLDQQAGLFAVDWVFCTLGTTIRQAGSQAAFRRVDFDYPMQVARLAKARGARHVLVVTALGADAGSRVFYSRVKGELEEALKDLGFDSLTLARPSVLLGERGDVRLGELLAQKLGFLTPPRYKPVHASQVAQGLVQAAHAGRPGVQVLDNMALRRLNPRQMG